MATIKGNKKVAKVRGEQWRKKLIQGKKDALVAPTKLKIARANRGVSQRQLASIIDVSLATYGGIERGKRSLSQKAASSIATHLKMSQTKLFKEAAKERLVAI